MSKAFQSFDSYFTYRYIKINIEKDNMHSSIYDNIAAVVTNNSLQKYWKRQAHRSPTQVLTNECSNMIIVIFLMDLLT